MRLGNSFDTIGRMKRFPDGVRAGMVATGAATTCVPVQLDGGAWEAAVFFQLAGPESKEDRRLLGKETGTVPVTVEADLLEHAQAALVLLRLEVLTKPHDPLVGEILFAPGDVALHFDTLRLLSQQTRLRWFFGDRECWLIHSQQNPLTEEQRSGFDSLLRDAVSHDALVRCAGRYDARAALSEVVAHYELRAATSRPSRVSQPAEN